MKLVRTLTLTADELKLLTGTEHVFKMLNNSFVLFDLNREDIESLDEWLIENMKALHAFRIDEETRSMVFYFLSDEDAMLFKLRWGGGNE